ncbi:MAG: hypothetical protein ACOYMN_08150 [Roseimicrobium sp.]
MLQDLTPEQLAAAQTAMQALRQTCLRLTLSMIGPLPLVCALKRVTAEAAIDNVLDEELREQAGQLFAEQFRAELDRANEPDRADEQQAYLDPP